MRLSLAAAVVVASAAPAAAQEPDFNRDVRPILAGKCFKCHGPDEKTRKGDLRLDVRGAAADALNPGKADASELVKRVHAELRLAMGVTGEPVFVKVVRWPRAIPQYELGHVGRVARIDAAAAGHPGLFLTGNALRGIAMGDCAEQGEVVSRAVLRYLADRSSLVATVDR